MSKTLEAWREETGLSREWVAKAIGVSTVAVGRYETGERRIPAPRVIQAIYDLTEGEVDANAWFDHGHVQRAVSAV